MMFCQLLDHISLRQLQSFLGCLHSMCLRYGRQKALADFFSQHAQIDQFFVNQIFHTKLLVK